MRANEPPLCGGKKQPPAGERARRRSRGGIVKRGRLAVRSWTRQLPASEKGGRVYGANARVVRGRDIAETERAKAERASRRAVACYITERKNIAENKKTPPKTAALFSEMGFSMM